jgi:phage tail sheath protein FI
MSDTFLHGVETIQSTKNAIVNTVKTAVIGLIGTAQTGDTNVLKCCLTEKDDIQFGTTGSIPEALSVIRRVTKSTGATILVVSLGAGSTPPADADFVGTLDPVTGIRTGLQLFDTAFSEFGYNAKIFIAPRFSNSAGVITALTDCAVKFRGAAYVDAPDGTTATGAIALRNTAQLWAGVNPRVKYLFPGQLYDESNTLRPFSAFSAGLRAKIDATSELSGGGFWVSSSNNVIDGVTGLETNITTSINDPTSETNLLNAAGIVTVFNNSGKDFREWGNRNASFTTSESGTNTFESFQRLQDITDESIELAMLPYIDKPIIKAFIDLVCETVNQYYNNLIARGAVIEGSKCIYEASKNSDAEIANGHVVFTKIFMGATPAERMTFDTVVDTSLLANSLN